MAKVGVVRACVGVFAVSLAMSAVAVGTAETAGAGVSASWSSTRPATAGSWDAVAFGAGRWVVLGQSSSEATSTNGTSWSVRAVPGGTWGTVEYAGGRFVALSSTDSSPHEMTSTNGLAWQTDSGPDGTWVAMAYGSGHYIAVSSLGLIALSTNGTSWTTTFSRRFDHFTGVAYGDGRFVVVDNLHGDTLESSDGVHWAFYAEPFAQQRWSGVAYGNGNFVAGDGTGSGSFATTDLGYEWALRPYAHAEQISGVSFGCNTFLAVGQPNGASNHIFSSSTGATWSSVAVPTDATGTWTATGFGGNHFVAVDSDGDIAWAKSVGPCGPTITNPPQQVSGNIHSGEVWTYMHPPTSDGGAAANRYRVTITGNGITKSCGAPVYFEPNCIIKGLKNHQVYEVAAQAHNQYGWSADSDPYFVIPVPSWTFAVTSPTPVVLEGTHIPVQVTGIQANGEGIYPVTIVSADVGPNTLTCRPSPFGECVFAAATPHLGAIALTGSYDGYGRYYRAKTSHVWVASVSPSATSVTASQRISVLIAGGPPTSPLHVTLDGRTGLGRLGAGGGGTATVSAPSALGTYTLTVIDDGVLLDRITITVHA